MTSSSGRSSFFAFAALVLGLAACSSTPDTPPPPPPGVKGATETQLSATLAAPTQIVLKWAGGDPGAAGLVVEFATEPDGKYTILAFVPPAQTSYTHSELIPHTTFYYRVRPYRGQASAAVEVNAASGLASGAPGDLTAIILGPDQVRFTWADKASGEDGYLLESKPLGGNDFRVIALLDPDSTSFDVITDPDERHAHFRLRAFTFGPPSNVAHRMTGG